MLASEMREAIHPQYYAEAVVHCMCGNTFTTGSTQPELKTEVCSQCHPFFTGKEHLIDTAGQVERFRKKQENVAAKAAAKKTGRA